MNSLLSYGSDDDLNDSGEDEYTVEPVRAAVSRNYRKSAGTNQDDTNYDEVQMSLSEDSDSEPSNKKSKEDRDHSHDRDTSGSKDFRRNSRDDRYTRDEDRSKHRDRDDKSDNRYKPRDDDRNKDRCADDREDERGTRDRRDDRGRRSKDRDRSSRDDRYSRDRRDRDRRRSRSRSRDRRRSRSPKRSRSRSRDRNTGRGGYYRKFDRSNRERFDNRNAFKSDSSNQTKIDENQPKDRFFMPGITGRFRDQIEKRKLLWQKGKEPEKIENVPVATITTPGTSSKTTKVWETTTFAQDSDGKVANKFKRLMGIKNPTETNKVTTEVLKKQEEMFTSMEAQYEVARTATHTMRGVGLGFGSYQR